MNTYFPLTTAINYDAEIIITAMHARAEEIKNDIASQSLLRSISVLALKTLGLAAAIVTCACLPVVALTFTVTPLIIAAGSLTVAITCLAIGIFLNPHSPGESIVKDLWKALFTALRQGKGLRIIQTSEELAKQERQRTNAYNNCLGILSPAEVRPFLHKTCLVGNLLMSLESLAKNEIEQTQEKAEKAYSFFEMSEFPHEVAHFIQAIKNTPMQIRHLIDLQAVVKGLHTLDYLLVKSQSDGCTCQHRI